MFETVTVVFKTEAFKTVRFKKIPSFLMLAGVLLGSLIAAQSVAKPAQTDLRDPTAPLGYAKGAKAKETLQLQAIFSGAGRKEAIISGFSVKTGDTVMGKRIIAINADNVVVQGASGSQVLRLRPSIFSQ